MRYWLSFRGPFGTRPGFSVSHRELFGKKPPAVSAAGMLGIFKRDTDGAIFLGVTDQNGENEHLANAKPVAAFAFSSADAAITAREGAIVRLAKHLNTNGLLVGVSVGQAVSVHQSRSGRPWASCAIRSGDRGAAEAAGGLGRNADGTVNRRDHVFNRPRSHHCGRVAWVAERIFN
jgi:hypothetical protein